MADSYNQLMDITTRYGTSSVSNDDYVSWRDADKTKDKTTLDFNDMLLLMVTQFQNQTIDNQADTSDMMNQLIQMTVMQAMTSMTTQMEELTTANIMSYSASLVGKEVTLGVYDENGKITEKVGVVQGTGTYNGSQVVFVDGESYFLSSIMGVGRLPALNKGEDTDGDTDADDKVDGDNTGDGDKVDGSGNTSGSTGSTEGAENSGAAGGTAGSGDGGSDNNTSDGETEVAGTNGAAGV